jgi:hypothetical protein
MLKGLAAFAIACVVPTMDVHAQSDWIDAAIPGFQIGVQQVCSSVDGTRLYYCGALIQDQTLGFYSNPVLRYANGAWSPLGIIPQVVRSVVEYHDTLIATGPFNVVADSLPVDHIAYWNGQQWLPYGSLRPLGARKLRVLDDTLYAVGSMDTADGQYVNGITRRVGGQWRPVGLLDTDGYSIMGDIVKFEDHLVAIGSGAINGELRVFQLQDGVWSILGGGIQGGLCSAQCLAVYNGDLYVGGQITMACGNPGQGILRWDGSAWQPVGLGLQYALGDFNSFAGPTTMMEHNGKLFIGGGFRYAGGVEAFGVATWDGTEWCGVTGNFSNGVGHTGVYSMDFYHDTLFVAANMADDDSVNFSAKFIGTEYADSCATVLTALPIQSPMPTNSMVIILANEMLTAQIPTGASPCRIELLDGLGRVINTGTGTSVPFSTLSLATGLYLLRAEGYGAQRVLLE